MEALLKFQEAAGDLLHAGKLLRTLDRALHCQAQGVAALMAAAEDRPSAELAARAASLQAALQQRQRLQSAAANAACRIHKVLPTYTACTARCAEAAGAACILNRYHNAWHAPVLNLPDAALQRVARLTGQRARLVCRALRALYGPAGATCLVHQQASGCYQTARSCPTAAPPPPLNPVARPPCPPIRSLVWLPPDHPPEPHLPLAPPCALIASKLSNLTDLSIATSTQLTALEHLQPLTALTALTCNFLDIGCGRADLGALLSRVPRLRKLVVHHLNLLAPEALPWHALASLSHLQALHLPVPHPSSRAPHPPHQLLQLALSDMDAQMQPPPHPAGHPPPGTFPHLCHTLRQMPSLTLLSLNLPHDPDPCFTDPPCQSALQALLASSALRALHIHNPHHLGPSVCLALSTMPQLTSLRLTSACNLRGPPPTPDLSALPNLRDLSLSIPLQAVHACLPPANALARLHLSLSPCLDPPSPMPQLLHAVLHTSPALTSLTLQTHTTAAGPRLPPSYGWMPALAQLRSLRHLHLKLGSSCCLAYLAMLPAVTSLHIHVQVRCPVACGGAKHEVDVMGLAVASSLRRLVVDNVTDAAPVYAAARQLPLLEELDVAPLKVPLPSDLQMLLPPPPQLTRLVLGWDLCHGKGPHSGVVAALRSCVDVVPRLPGWVRGCPR